MFYNRTIQQAIQKAYERRLMMEAMNENTQEIAA